MPLLEAVRYAQTVTLPAEIHRAPRLLVQGTRGTAVVFLWKANAVNSLLPVD